MNFRKWKETKAFVIEIEFRKTINNNSNQNYKLFDRLGTENGSTQNIIDFHYRKFNQIKVQSHISCALAYNIPFYIILYGPYNMSHMIRAILYHNQFSIESQTVLSILIQKMQRSNKGLTWIHLKFHQALVHAFIGF